MKNRFENMILTIVSILAILLMALVYRYVTLKGDDSIAIYIDAKKQISTKTANTNYIKSLEGYKENEIDVQSNGANEDSTNRIVVVSELSGNSIEEIVKDSSKASYLENLKVYENGDNSGKKVDKNEPKILPPQEGGDSIGSAIDALLDI